MAAGVEISSPPHPVLKPGHWSYLPVELTNIEATFQGLLSITIGNNTFQQEVLLSPPSKKIYHLPFFSSTPLRCLPLSLLAGGKAIERKEICFENIPPQHLLLLLVKDGQKNMALSLKSKNPDAPFYGNQVGSAEFPRNWIALASYDIILMAPSLLNRFDHQQIEALMLWVMEGKNLVLMQGRELLSLPEDFTGFLSRIPFVNVTLNSADPSQTKITVQKAFLGQGSLFILPWQADQEQELDLALRSFQYELFTPNRSLMSSLTSAEKQKILDEIEKESSSHIFPYTLPAIVLAYLAGFLLFWFFIVPRLKLKPLMLIFTLLFFPWPFTVIIMGQHLILTGQRSPVLTETTQICRILPTTGYAFLEKFITFTAVGTGKNSDLYFKYTGNLQPNIPSLRKPFGYNLIWKEDKPGFIMPGQKWHLGQKRAFLWEGFIPFTGYIEVHVANDTVGVIDSVQNRFSGPVNDLYLFSPKEQKIWYFGKLEPTQEVQFSRGKEIDLFSEIDFKNKPAWLQMAWHRVVQHNQTQPALIAWIDSRTIPELTGIEGIEEAKSGGNQQVFFIQYVSTNKKLPEEAEAE